MRLLEEVFILVICLVCLNLLICRITNKFHLPMLKNPKSGILGIKKLNMKHRFCHIQRISLFRISDLDFVVFVGIIR